MTDITITSPIIPISVSIPIMPVGTVGINPPTGGSGTVIGSPTSGKGTPGYGNVEYVNGAWIVAAPSTLPTLAASS